jgi:hypothetical protein
MRFLVPMLFCFFLISCTSSYNEAVLQDLPLTKQRQRITFLQKKLQMAEREQKKIETEVEWLHEEISLAKLTVISKLVDDSEKEIQLNPKKWSKVQSETLFLKEREALYEMVQTSSYSFEAQLVLDKLLQMITELSDRPKMSQESVFQQQ